ncbi:hypothetical protein LTR36_001049 [Oleoguttula mirabilis]|uniref:Uncharacterized protein n=1 Tax=Oleoguttula mirabilis TaxID=1507867 RepID=A0AAV9JS95_9PEZI|nr:hypothetical protein LTR36_001049 [Oleoguttula mirabilis]
MALTTSAGLAPQTEHARSGVAITKSSSYTRAADAPVTPRGTAPQTQMYSPPSPATNRSATAGRRYNDPEVFEPYIAAPTTSIAYPTALTDADLKTPAGEVGSGAAGPPRTQQPRASYHANVVPFPTSAAPNAQGRPNNAAMTSWLSGVNAPYAPGYGQRRN